MAKTVTKNNTLGKISIKIIQYSNICFSFVTRDFLMLNYLKKSRLNLCLKNQNTLSVIFGTIPKYNWISRCAADIPFVADHWDDTRSIELGKTFLYFIIYFLLRSKNDISIKKSYSWQNIWRKKKVTFSVYVILHKYNFISFKILKRNLVSYIYI